MLLCCFYAIFCWTLLPLLELCFSCFVAFYFFGGGDRFDIVVVCPCFVVFGLIVRYFYIPHVYLACFLKAVSLLCSALKTIFCFCFLQLVVLCVVCASLLCIFLLFCLFVCLFVFDCFAFWLVYLVCFVFFSASKARASKPRKEIRQQRKLGCKVIAIRLEAITSKKAGKKERLHAINEPKLHQGRASTPSKFCTLYPQFAACPQI